jgi:hypothetical protein
MGVSVTRRKGRRLMGRYRYDGWDEAELRPALQHDETPEERLLRMVFEANTAQVDADAERRAYWRSGWRSFFAFLGVLLIVIGVLVIVWTRPLG